MALVLIVAGAPPYDVIEIGLLDGASKRISRQEDSVSCRVLSAVHLRNRSPRHCNRARTIVVIAGIAVEIIIGRTAHRSLKAQQEHC